MTPGKQALNNLEEMGTKRESILPQTTPLQGEEGKISAENSRPGGSKGSTPPVSLLNNTALSSQQLPSGQYFYTHFKGTETEA